MADMNLCFVSISIICVVQLLSCEAARITLLPASLTVSSNLTNSKRELSIRCQPPTSGVDTVLGLKIGRQPTNSPNVESTPLANAVTGKDDGDPKLLPSGAALTNVSVSGNVQSSITLTFMAGCTDEYNYTCGASVLDNTGNFPKTTEGKILKVDVSPGQLELQVTPDFKNLWAVNETLRMECSGSVGSVESSDGSTIPINTNQISWVWEYRSETGSSTSWSPYDGPSSDIQLGATINRQCYQEQTSILTRRLTLLDNRREYRCYVRRGGTQYTQFADTHFVGTVTEDGSGPDPDTPSSPSSANVGAIVGGTMGALIVVAIIVVVVYFLVIRPRRQSDGDGGENPEKGPDADWGPTAVEPASTDDPSVTYAKPSRKSKLEGTANKAMNESDEVDTKSPRDNDDKRHGRRKKDKIPHDEKPPVIATDDSQYDSQYDPKPQHYDYDQYNPKPSRRDDKREDRDQRRGHRSRDDNEERPRSRRHDNDRPDNPDKPSRGRRHRDDDYYPDRYDDDGYGRRNHGYDYDNRHGGRNSSDDGGHDSYVNTSHYSMGDGDPSVGTAI